VRALDVVALLRDRWPKCWTRLSSRLDLGATELRQWRSVADKIATGFDAKTGLFEEFEGYFALEKINLADYAGRSVPMDVVLGRERTQKIPGDQTGRCRGAGGAPARGVCWRYGGSELPLLRASMRPREFPQPIHAWARRRPARPLRYGATLLSAERGDRSFRYPCRDRRRHPHRGPRRLVVLGFAGLSLHNDGIGLDPQLPACWRRLAFDVQWHGRNLKIRIDQDKQRLEATLASRAPMTIVVRRESHENDHLLFHLR
jgi:hypothetical protein